MNSPTPFQNDPTHIGTVVLVRDMERCDVKVRRGDSDLVVTAHLARDLAGRPTIGSNVALRKTPSSGYAITDILSHPQATTRVDFKGRRASQGYDRNDGRPGVVYILQNEAFAENIWKIGQSTRSGHVRAADLNRAAGTETPKHFRCVFEHKTLDCGRAEKMVFEALRQHRYGASRQEYFRVELERATRTIRECCAQVDAAAQRPPTAVVGSVPKSISRAVQSSKPIAPTKEASHRISSITTPREPPSASPLSRLGKMLMAMLALTFLFGLVTATIGGVIFSLLGWILSALGFLHDADRSILTRFGSLVGLAVPAGFMLISPLLPDKKRKNS